MELLPIIILLTVSQLENEFIVLELNMAAVTYSLQTTKTKKLRLLVPGADGFAINWKPRAGHGLDIRSTAADHFPLTSSAVYVPVSTHSYLSAPSYPFTSSIPLVGL